MSVSSFRSGLSAMHERIRANFQGAWECLGDESAGSGKNTGETLFMRKGGQARCSERTRF